MGTRTLVKLCYGCVKEGDEKEKGVFVGIVRDKNKDTSKVVYSCGLGLDCMTAHLAQVLNNYAIELDRLSDDYSLEHSRFV